MGESDDRSRNTPGAGPIGFVGLGHMGTPLARCLQRAGHRVIGHDVDAARPSAAGIEAAASAAELAGRVDVVLLSLPDGEVVRGVVEELAAAREHAADRRGIDPGDDELLIVVDTSSSDPGGTVALGRRLAQQGTTVLVDAPVSGGVVRAEAGDLAVMLGGDEPAVLDRVEAIVACFARQVVRTGALGSGHATKALNNVLAAMNTAAVAEVLAAGVHFGLDPHVLLGALNLGSGRSNASETKAAQFMLSGRYDAGFTIELMVKDLAIGEHVAAPLAEDLRLLPATVALWREALDELGADRDHTEIARWVEQRTGVTLRR